MLDPVGWLARVLKDMVKGGNNFILEDAQSALCDEIRLLGNTSSQISKLRRWKILKTANPDNLDLADEKI